MNSVRHRKPCDTQSKRIFSKLKWTKNKAHHTKCKACENKRAHTKTVANAISISSSITKQCVLHQFIDTTGFWLLLLYFWHTHTQQRSFPCHSKNSTTPVRKNCSKQQHPHSQIAETLYHNINMLVKPMFVVPAEC